MTWKTTNKIVNKKGNLNKLPKAFFQNTAKEFIVEPVQIANNFNDYFTNAGHELARKIDNNSPNTFQRYLSGHYKESIFIDPILLKMKCKLKNT